MKINDLIQNFEIFLTNEEKDILPKLQQLRLREEFTEREQYVIENMVKKSVVTKVKYNGETYLVQNEQSSS